VKRTIQTSLDRPEGMIDVTVHASVVPAIGEPGSLSIEGGPDIDVYRVVNNHDLRPVEVTDQEYAEIKTLIAEGMKR
jgi:hypothetical protein